MHRLTAGQRAEQRHRHHQLPVFAMLAHGSAAGLASPFCSNSMEYRQASAQRPCSHHAAAVDRDARLHQPVARRIDIIHPVGEMAEIAAAVYLCSS